MKDLNLAAACAVRIAAERRAACTAANRPPDATNASNCTNLTCEVANATHLNPAIASAITFDLGAPPLDTIAAYDLLLNDPIATGEIFRVALSYRRHDYGVEDLSPRGLRRRASARATYDRDPRDLAARYGRFFCPCDIRLRPPARDFKSTWPAAQGEPPPRDGWRLQWRPAGARLAGVQHIDLIDTCAARRDEHGSSFATPLLPDDSTVPPQISGRIYDDGYTYPKGYEEHYYNTSMGYLGGEQPSAHGDFYRYSGCLVGLHLKYDAPHLCLSKFNPLDVELHAEYAEYELSESNVCSALDRQPFDPHNYAAYAEPSRILCFRDLVHCAEYVIDPDCGDYFDAWTAVVYDHNLDIIVPTKGQPGAGSIFVVFPDVASAQHELSSGNASRILRTFFGQEELEDEGSHSERECQCQSDPFWTERACTCGAAADCEEQQPDRVTCEFYPEDRLRRGIVTDSFCTVCPDAVLQTTCYDPDFHDADPDDRDCPGALSLFEILNVLNAFDDHGCALRHADGRRQHAWTPSADIQADLVARVTTVESPPHPPEPDPSTTPAAIADPDAITVVTASTDPSSPLHHGPPSLILSSIIQDSIVTDLETTGACSDFSTDVNLGTAKPPKLPPEPPRRAADGDQGNNLKPPPRPPEAVCDTGRPPGAPAVPLVVPAAPWPPDAKRDLYADAAARLTDAADRASAAA